MYCKQRTPWSSLGLSVATSERTLEFSHYAVSSGSIIVFVRGELERMRQEPVVHFSTEYFVTIRPETSHLFLISSIMEIEYRDKYGIISVLSFGKGQVLVCPIVCLVLEHGKYWSVQFFWKFPAFARLSFW